MFVLEGRLLRAKQFLLLRILSLFSSVAVSRIRGRPFFISHLVTTRCHCKCPMCLWRDQQSFEEMSAEEIGSFYRESRRQGFVKVAIWGGEPLMRKDLGEILYQARQSSLITVLLTNGYYLQERLEELAPYLDAVILSLDYAGEKHDRMRGCPGLFQRVISAVDTLRRRYPRIKVFFNCLLHRGNEDQVFTLAELAQKSNVSFYVCPVKAETFPDTVSKAEKWKADPQHENLAGEQLRVLKRSGYPVNNSYTYLQSFLKERIPYNCHLPKIALLVYPNGEVVNCLDRASNLGNVREQSLAEILENPRYKELKSKAIDCNHCNNPNVVESSFIWELRKEPLFNAVKVLLKSK